MTIYDLPRGAKRPPAPTPHFPTNFQTVIWRNLGPLTARGVANVLGVTDEVVLAEAAKMGLSHFDDEALERLWLQRGYITLIRQNWHLLPYEQLLALLGWTPEQLDYALKEDDFLWNKLGRYKPEIPPVRWAALTEEQERETAAIKRLMEESFSEFADAPAARPFDFLANYGVARMASHGQPSGDSSFGMKLAYSYSAVYGDPLLDPDLDPYPDGLLSDLAANGMNAVWLQGVLYTLVPWFGETSLSKGCERRLENLNALIERAANHGIGVYLYLNEPRGMRPEFFRDFPDWKGGYQAETNLNAMCVSNPEILRRLKAGVGDLFRQAPGLAGVFTITLSENLTHCHSKGCDPACPRCADKNTGEMVASVNNAIAEGIHEVKPDADVIVWNWAWYEDWWKRAVDEFRSDLKLMCTSESYLPTEAMGVKGLVGDYTMSKPGPGPFADEVWRRAADRGLEILAKVQINNTWECSAVPYLPVPFLVKEHINNLKERGVSGLMVSWTLGGYPGGNLRLTDEEPEDLALEWFGERAAPDVLKAWRAFGEAFAEFPLNGAACLYTGPQNYGPMNLLFETPSGMEATMVGYPYDGLDRWRGNHYPKDVFEEQFRKLSEGWGDGLGVLRGIESMLAEESHKANFADLLTVAEAAYCHFRSSYLQIRFIRLRDGERTADSKRAIVAVLQEEIELAKTLLGIVRVDSRVGFEASNHYYYTENSLKEKVINCERLLAKFRE